MQFVIVPFKNFLEAKSRMRKTVSYDTTIKIVKIMLEHVLSEIKNSKKSDKNFIVTKDKEAVKLAEKFGFDVLLEEKQSGESSSVDWASKKLYEIGASSVLRLPADLPLIESRDVDEIFERSNETNSSILVPSRSGLGTNAFLRSPPEIVPSFFGSNSMEKHIAAFEEKGADYSVVKNENIGFDVDSGEDLKELGLLAKRSLAVTSILNLIN